MAISDMYPAMVGSPVTTTTADIGAQATSISVSDGSVFPDGPNLAVLSDGEDVEIVLYRAKSGGTLSNITRGMGNSTAKPWGAGTDISRNITSFDHDRFIENIRTLASEKAPIANPNFSGTPQADTAAYGTNTRQLATTAFVQATLSGKQDAFNDTGWVDITSSDVVVANYGLFQCRRFGPFVEVIADRIQLAAKLTSDEVNLGRLSTDFRPNGRVMALCTNRSIQYASYVIIYPDGYIHFSKNNNDTEINTGVNLYFCAMYFAGA